MEGRAVNLLVSSCVGVSPSAKLENWIENAKKTANFDHNVDTFQVAVVVFGEGPSLSEINCKDNFVHDESLVGALLETHQVTSIPSVVIVKKASHGPEQGEVLQFQDESSESGTADEHCDAAIEAYNEFNIHEAVSRFEAALRLDPQHKKALFNLASVVHMLDYPTLAVGLITRLLLLDGEDTIAHSFLWALNNTGKCTGAAINAYTLLAAAGDTAAVTKLATLTGTGSTASRGDPVYAEKIYDDMAAKFESKLVDCLGYKGPWLMRELLEGVVRGSGGSGSGGGGGDVGSEDTHVQMRPKGEWRVLDVGCGSGLVGKVFGDYVRTNNPDSGSSSATTDQNTITSTTPTTSTPITLHSIPYTSHGLMAGIDVSGRILEVARNTGMYECAEKWDLTAALRVLGVKGGSDGSSVGGSSADANSDGGVAIGAAGTGGVANVATSSTTTTTRTGLDMVIAADTFIYVGALGEVFALVYDALRDAASVDSDSRSVGSNYGGLFMFSTEDLESSPMRIETHKITTINNSAAPTDASNPNTTNTSTTADDYELAGAVPGWGGQLLKSARFAHSDSYIRALCERYKFRVLVHERIVLRTEETIPLPGNIYILQKVA